MLVGFVFGMSLVVSDVPVAYGHGCQAQGGCCTVGSSCVELSANSPIFLMFAAVIAGAVVMYAFYNKPDQRRQLGAIFNIFV